MCGYPSIAPEIPVADFRSSIVRTTPDHAVRIVVKVAAGHAHDGPPGK